MPPKEIPIFKGTDIEKIQKCVRWVKKNVKLKRWKTEQIEKEFGNRTPKQIIESGNSFYMRNCLDRTVVAMEVLKRNGFQPKMLIETLQYQGQEGFHFALELQAGKKLHTIDFITMEQVNIYQGTYKNARGAKRIEIFSFPSEKFSMEKNLWDAIGKTTNDFGIKFSLKTAKKKMARDNTKRRFLAVKTHSGLRQTISKIRRK